MSKETKQQTYKDLHIWQKAVELGQQAFLLEKKSKQLYESKYLHSLAESALRTASIIAEGKIRYSRVAMKDATTQALIEMGVFETNLAFCRDSKCISSKDFASLDEAALAINKMLVKFRGALKEKTQGTNAS
jgi:four helix bundle protein